MYNLKSEKREKTQRISCPYCGKKEFYLNGEINNSKKIRCKVCGEWIKFVG